VIKAIDTIYNGYKFRSRLEARWAIFFDSISAKYEYEKEGYDLDGEWYLPDFWMIEWNCWIEIKPTILRLPLGYMTQKNDYIEPKKELSLCRKLSDNTNNVVLLIGGNPWINNLNDEPNESPYYNFNYEIITFLPKSILYSNNFDKALQETKFKLKMEKSHVDLLDQKFYTSSKENTLYWFITNKYKNNPQFFDMPCPKRGAVKDLIDADKKYYLSKNCCENPKWKYGLTDDRFVFEIKKNRISLIDECSARSVQNSKLLIAYENAQQARFEKGKT